jgi:hypothetical protein
MSDPANEVSVLDLCELIDWLAIPYGDNDPLWPLVHPTTGEPMPHNARLDRTWHAVVRRLEAPVVRKPEASRQVTAYTSLTPSEVPGVEEGDTNGNEGH